MQGERKDAQEEFFNLLVISAKLNHQKYCPTIMKVDQKVLYKQVKDLKKPFNEWP